MEPAFKRARTSALAHELGLGMDMQDTCVGFEHFNHYAADIKLFSGAPTMYCLIQEELVGQPDGAYGSAQHRG